MQDIFQYANEHLGKAAMAQKKNYDKGLKTRSFNIGTFVWRWYPPKANKKLGLGWDGPYLVVDKLSDFVLRVQKSQASPVVSVHIDHLKAYEGVSAPPSWLKEVENPPHHESEMPLTDPDSDQDTFVDTVNVDVDVHIDDMNQTPPLRTRLGRLIKPRIRYSP